METQNYFCYLIICCGREIVEYYKHVQNPEIFCAKNLAGWQIWNASSVDT